MCHYYGNALSLLNEGFLDDVSMTAETFEAVRILPSFRDLIEKTLETGQSFQAQMLMEKDQILLGTMKDNLKEGKMATLAIFRAIYLLESLSSEPVELADLYVNAVEGRLEASNTVSKLLDTLKRMNPEELVEFTSRMRTTIETGCADMDLKGWDTECAETIEHLSVVMEHLAKLIKDSKESGVPLQSSYAIHNKGLRTTIIAQRVQLSYEKSSLSEQDQAFTSIVDKVSTALRESLACLKPTDIFLHEVWLYDSIVPMQDVFTPRPRHAIEHALSMPYNYLQCACCTVKEDLSAVQPTTAILYQMCLQAGSLVNISDLWTTFCDSQQRTEEEGFNEREALAEFYKGLVELKLLGLIKQSKKKIDHLAKISWMGL
jgi:origin recognition complex subunit 3